MREFFLARLFSDDGHSRSLCRIYSGEREAWLDADELVKPNEVARVYRREPHGIWSVKERWESLPWEDCDAEGCREAERIFDDFLADEAQGVYEEHFGGRKAA